MDGPSLRGKLLVANPALPDPNFDRTVIFLIEHGTGGALGVVLNRPSDTEVAEVLPAWGAAVGDPAVVFVGGPVERHQALALGRSSPPAAGAAGGLRHAVIDDVGVVDLDGDPTRAGSCVRLFAGYAGWDGGQLEGELEAHGWFVADASPADVFTTDPEALWSDVLRRQRPALAMLSAFPRDPSRN